MLLYVNGNTISGGACCANDFVQADDDIHYVAQYNKSHPDNVMHSFGYYLSRLLNVGFRCEANNKESNSETFEQTTYFLTNTLPMLKSMYTVVCIGLMPQVDVTALNKLAALCKIQNIEFIVFNTHKPLPTTASVEFGNLIDLKDESECFVTWCKNNNHVLKNNMYPDVDAHNAWAKYIFSKLIENL